MQQQFLIDELQTISKNTQIQQDNINTLWKEISEYQFLIKEITCKKNQKKQQIKKMLIEVVVLIIPFLNIKDIFNLRLLNRTILIHLKNNKNKIIQSIEKEIQQNQKVLYNFNIFSQTSRDLYAHIIKLNIYASKIKEMKNQKELAKIIEKICDPTQIYATEVAGNKNPFEQIKFLNKTQKELFQNYEKNVWLLNWDLAQDYSEYRKEILRQKKIKRLQKLKEITDNF